MKLKITGLDATIKKMENLSRDTATKTQQALNAFGLSVEATAKQLCPANEGRLRNSISYVPGDLSVSIVAATNYAAYVEFGTRKFAAEYIASLPPDWKTYAATFRGQGGGTFNEMLESLMTWARLKGIGEDAAYPIARKILTEGVRAQPFIYPAINAHTKELVDDIKAIFK